MSDLDTMQGVLKERDRLSAIAHERFPHLTKTQKEAIEFIASQGAMLAHTNGLTETRYKSFEELVINVGKVSPWHEPPEHIDMLEPGQCYANALLTARQHDLTYVEGFAYTIIPTMHAWCEDDQGRVVDPTWDSPSYETIDAVLYLGIPMNLNKVAARVVRQGTYGVLPQGDITLLDGGIEELML